MDDIVWGDVLPSVVGGICACGLDHGEVRTMSIHTEMDGYLDRHIQNLVGRFYLPDDVPGSKDVVPDRGISLLV